MNLDMELKRRLFFGVQVFAPWSEECFKGRLLNEEQRHMTLVFLGNVDYQKVMDLLPLLPKPSWKVGSAAFFDHPLFLPNSSHPNVHAWHVEWINKNNPLLMYQKALSDFLRTQGFHLEERKFLPHVTICRSPFHTDEWLHAFHPLPCYFKNIHLYESKGNLQYESLWDFPIIAPFEEIDHTADVAFKIRGESLEQIFYNAQLALSFRSPSLIGYLKEQAVGSSLNEIIKRLNGMIFRADSEVGCPYKAISYHGVVTESNGVLEWEMIVDV